MNNLMIEVESASTSKGPVAKREQYTWEQRFRQLEDYKSEHGDCEVPASYSPDKAYGLGRWVTNQRTAHKMMKEGKPTKYALTQERVEKLQKLGFRFVWDRWDKWDKMFGELKSYFEDVGDCFVPSTNRSLYHWVLAQRRKFKNGDLPQNRIAALKEIDFVFDYHKWNWEEMFSSLRNYHGVKGNCNVPANWSDQKLAYWVAYQRKGYKIYVKDESASWLTPERISSLNAIGFKWALRAPKGMMTRARTRRFGQI